MADDPTNRPRNAHEALDELQVTRAAMLNPVQHVPVPVSPPRSNVASFLVAGGAAMMAVVLFLFLFLFAVAGMAVATIDRPEAVQVVQPPVVQAVPQQQQMDPAFPAEDSQLPPPRPLDEGSPPTEPGPYPPLGDPETAVVAFHLFTDFQCPFCKRFEPTVAAVHEAYPDDVVIYFHDTPLPFHKDAFGAHEAARCANEQGRFHDMKDVLFVNNTRLQRENLRQYALQVELEVGAFEDCMQSKRYTEAIANAYELAKTYGVTGTPSSWVGSQKLVGAQPLDKVLEMVAAEVARNRR